MGAAGATGSCRASQFVSVPRPMGRGKWGQPPSRDIAALAAQRRADANPGCSQRPSLYASCCHPLEVNAVWRELGCLGFLPPHPAKELQFFICYSDMAMRYQLALQSAFKF